MRSARVGSASAVPFVLAVACLFASAQDGKKPEPKEKPAKADAGKSDAGKAKAAADDPVKDDDPELPIKDLRAGKDEKKRYVVIGPQKGAKEPKDGWKTLFVLPGGTGGADFHGFVKNVARQVFSDEYLVVQLVAPKWVEKQQIIWPTEGVKLKEAEFTTEAFFLAVHKELAKAHRLDPKRCFTLSWSSGGPAAYRLALMDKTPVTGSYVAQAVFKPNTLPPLKAAKGKAFFLDHSPEDQTCPFRDAETARDDLKKAGAATELVSYEGGHGWHGALWERLKRGREFLEKNSKN